jgi:hypothetical protein
MTNEMLNDLNPPLCDCWRCSDHQRVKDDAVYAPVAMMQPFIPQERVNSSGWSADFRSFNDIYPSRY